MAGWSNTPASRKGVPISPNKIHGDMTRHKIDHSPLLQRRRQRRLRLARVAQPGRAVAVGQRGQRVRLRDGHEAVQELADEAAAFPAVGFGGAREGGHGGLGLLLLLALEVDVDRWPLGLGGYRDRGAGAASPTPRTARLSSKVASSAGLLDARHGRGGG